MTSYREQRGSCVIEAGALDLDNGSHWKPWLKLTHCAGAVSASRTFDRLKPVFGTQEAALRYATEVGRRLVDAGFMLDPASRNQKAATWPQNPAGIQSCSYRSRKMPAAQGYRTAASMVRTLASLFARTESASVMRQQPEIELYLAAATSHAEFERRMRETERATLSFAVTYSH